MPGELVLFFGSGLSALVTLVIFLESWFALSGKTRLPARRVSGAYGVVSVFVHLRGSVEPVLPALQSIFEQSYPFIELFLIFYEDDSRHAGTARRFRAMRSHIPVRMVATTFPLESEADRIRALEQARTQSRGSWMVQLDADVVLDRYAIESALELAGTEEIPALSLSPGIRCRSLFHLLLAPPMEWISHLIRGLDRGSEVQPASEPFLLMNAEAHELVHRINRIPGILNEAGWNLWSYKAEGLKTFAGDGSGWMWREASLASWGAHLRAASRRAGRAIACVAGGMIVSALVVAGIVFGLTAGEGRFFTDSILYFSAFGYALMAASYFLYSRRLGAARWFSPLWFLAHWTASGLILIELHRQFRSRLRARPESRTTEALRHRGSR